MKTKEEMAYKINSFNTRTTAFTKNIIEITKKFLAEWKLETDVYGEALFTYKVLKENIVKAEYRIIDFVENNKLSYSELKSALDILIINKEMERIGKKCIKILKKYKKINKEENPEIEKVIRIIEIYDIFVIGYEDKIIIKEENGYKIADNYDQTINNLFETKEYEEIKKEIPNISQYLELVLDLPLDI